MRYAFKNLVFEGGGVKGVAYAGAISVIERKGILDNIERVAGTSVGAITAGLVSVGFNSKEISEILKKLNLKSLRDDSFFFPLNIARLFNKYGWYKGNAFEAWFRDVISKKVNPDITFSELYKMKGKNGIKELYVIGAELNKKDQIVFCHDNTPHVSIVKAVRISMSIPLFFQSVKMGSSVYVDGGIFNAYPIGLFDNKKYCLNLSQNKTYNKETLGFRVDSEEEIDIIKEIELPNIKIRSLKDYIEALVGGLIDQANKRHLSDKDWHRTVFIDSLGISATDFNITSSQKNSLVQSGEDYTNNYFNWFDSKSSRPLNK